MMSRGQGLLKELAEAALLIVVLFEILMESPAS
jgi:hypothetical protein